MQRWHYVISADRGKTIYYKPFTEYVFSTIMIHEQNSKDVGADQATHYCTQCSDCDHRLINPVPMW
jgi:hypothetical protein